MGGSAASRKLDDRVFGVWLMPTTYRDCVGAHPWELMPGAALAADMTFLARHSQARATPKIPILFSFLPLFLTVAPLNFSLLPWFPPRLYYCMYGSFHQTTMYILPFTSAKLHFPSSSQPTPAQPSPAFASNASFPTIPSASLLFFPFSRVLACRFENLRWITLRWTIPY